MTVLAEKLAERKDLVTLIGRLDDEIATALVYEDDGFPENAKAEREKAEAEVARLDGQLMSALDTLEKLENTIRAANQRANLVVDKVTMSISEAIVLRDRLKTEYNARKTIADATDPTGRSSRRRDIYGYGLERRKKDEIELRSVKDGRTAREEADAVARKLRLLDAEIQKVNWSQEV